MVSIFCIELGFLLGIPDGCKIRLEEDLSLGFAEKL
jgi:hypothetical protein